MTSDDQHLLIAEARIARQREIIALLRVRGKDTTEAKSLLSGLQYSLRLLKQRRRAGSRWLGNTGEQRIPHDVKRRRYSASGAP